VGLRRPILLSSAHTLLSEVRVLPGRGRGQLGNRL